MGCKSKIRLTRYTKVCTTKTQKLSHSYMRLFASLLENQLLVILTVTADKSSGLHGMGRYAKMTISETITPKRLLKSRLRYTNCA